jgi:hypothetical protein
LEQLVIFIEDFLIFVGFFSLLFFFATKGLKTPPKAKIGKKLTFQERQQGLGWRERCQPLWHQGSGREPRKLGPMGRTSFARSIGKRFQFEKDIQK